jgi:hypothetical protein
LTATIKKNNIFLDFSAWDLLYNTCQNKYLAQRLGVSPSNLPLDSLDVYITGRSSPVIITTPDDRTGTLIIRQGNMQIR